MSRVGVVGAGISGLAVVRALAERGIDAVAFEATAEPGGLMRSREVEGRVLELGPQRLRLTPQIERLLADLDLLGELRHGSEGGSLYVYWDGRLRVAPLSVREAIATDLLSWRGKLRMLGEPLADPPRPGESVEAFLARSFGREAAERYLGPIYSGLYGTAPDEMPVEHSLARALETFGVEGSMLRWALKRILRRRETPPIVTLEDGLGTIPRAIRTRHAEAVHLETPVERIRPDGEGFLLETAAGTTAVDAVVVTTPAGTAARLLEPVDDGYGALASLSYNPIAIVYLESDFDGAGVGAIVPDSEDLAISGCTWNASLLDRDRLFTCYVDPGSYPGLLEADEDAVGRAAAAAFETMTGAPASVLSVHRWNPGMPAYDRSWTALAGVPDWPDVYLCANYVDRPGIPGRLRHAERVADAIDRE